MDPSGLISKAAVELQKIIKFKIEYLKGLTKEIGNNGNERGGVIEKAKSESTKPKYKMLEETGTERTTHSINIKTYGPENDPNHMIKTKPGDTKVDCTRDAVPVNELDPDYMVEFTWHIHGPDGEPVPSEDDRKDAENRNMPDFLIHFNPYNNTWSMWIIDKDGSTHRYEPPADKKGNSSGNSDGKSSDNNNGKSSNCPV